jgi:pyocin large subunit-like protein
LPTSCGNAVPEEFKPPLTIDEYEARAKGFFSSEPTNSTLWFYDVDAILYRYDEASNEFGMCTPSGVMITYFLPKNKLIYWYRQVEQYAI